MIMVQKAPGHLLSSPSSHHRRLPSAPTVSVQATRTPGLLSLSKPAQSPRSQPRQQQARFPRAAHKTNSKPSAASANASSKDLQATHDVAGAQDGATVQQKAQNSLAPVPSAPQEKSPRGRQNGKQTKAKDVPRSNSQTRTNIRRHPHHQGSPPLHSQIPSQAEVLTASNRPSYPRSHSLTQRIRNPNSNTFDPFLASSDSENSGPEHAAKPTATARAQAGAPKLASRPSGKLARRRQVVPELPGTPTPPSSKAVPVPRGPKRTREPKSLNLSRSDPVLSTNPARPGITHSSSSAFNEFPVCDDMTEDEAEGEVKPPSTPVKAGNTTWQQALLFDDGPRTAPLASTFLGSPFLPSPTSTPSPAERKRQHVRSPSEGVFDLSMDEGTSSSDASEELKALVGLLPRRRISSTPPGSNSSPQKPGFFASSNFQNSPSPDDLPPPAFGLGF